MFTGRIFNCLGLCFLKLLFDIFLTIFFLILSFLPLFLRDLFNDFVGRLCDYARVRAIFNTLRFAIFAILNALFVNTFGCGVVFVTGQISQALVYGLLDQSRLSLYRRRYLSFFNCGFITTLCYGFLNNG